MKKFLTVFTVLLLLLGTAGFANAVIVDFTGGTAYLVGGGTVVTNNTITAATAFGATDYYEENGFKLDFIGEGGIIGDYYGGSNDVIHGHWYTGDYGTLTEIRISKLDNTTFDLNYFQLTSNTDVGGDGASGNELTYVGAFDSADSQIGSSVLLPSDDWGWAGTNPSVFLGSDFDNAAYVKFWVGNSVDCFGMDMFYIDEPAPVVPIPAAAWIFGSGLIGIVGIRRKFQK